MAEGWVTASYNALNQPIAIWSPNMPAGAFTWFGYDPLGRCVKRWVSDSGDVYSNPATYFQYDGWNLLQEAMNAWGPARVYVHGNRVDEIVWSYNTFTGDQAFHHYDARGHCTLLTDNLGSILEQYEYDAFGHAYFYDAAGTATTVNGQPDSLFGNRFLFTGREWLSDLRLYDYRNRMYQPELGRFLQPDPKEFAAGDYNLYRYCHNDPVNKSDPLGLDISAVDWALRSGPIQIEKIGNWGDKNSADYYKGGLTANGRPAEGVTDAVMTAPQAQNDGGVKAKLFVETHVLSTHKDDKVDKKEQEHPDRWKEFHRTLSDNVLQQMIKDPNSYDSSKAFGESRASHVQKLFNEEKEKQRVMDRPGGPHDYSKPWNR